MVSYLKSFRTLWTLSAYAAVKFINFEVGTVKNGYAQLCFGDQQAVNQKDVKLPMFTLLELTIVTPHSWIMYANWNYTVTHKNARDLVNLWHKII